MTPTHDLIRFARNGTALLPANDELTDTLQQHSTGWRSNPAMRALVGDYTRSHWVLVIVGGAFVVALAVLAVMCWRRFRRAPRATTGTASTERRVYGTVAATLTLAGLAMGLIVAANLSTAAEPIPGFLQASAHPTPNSRAVDDAVIDWVQSGATSVPTIVETKVDDRVAWQLPKAIVCGLLLIAFTGLAVRLGRSLIRRSRAGEPVVHRRRQLGVQLATTCAALLMMVMFVANLQGALAPLTITVLGGS
ncbi:MAG: hypothetical protein WCC60_15300 [Ilumatobacteraceae bacterium]